MMRVTFLALTALVCSLPHIACADLRIDEHALRMHALFEAIEDPLDRLVIMDQRAIEALLIPVPGILTSLFGPRADPFYRGMAFHEGIDIAKPIGSLIRAAGGGLVSAAGTMGRCGRGLVIDHGKGLATRYCHLAELLVRRGERVSAGDSIGRVGSSGRATGPHLHFEVRDHGHPVDPVEHLCF